MAQFEDTLSTTAASRFQRRWNFGWGLVLYVVVVVAIVRALLDLDRLAGHPAVLFALVLGTLGWQLWFVTLHPQWPENQLVPMACYFAGLLVLAWSLTMVHPAFLLVAASGLFVTFIALPGNWAYLGLMATGVLLAGILGGLPPDSQTAWQMAGSTVIAAGLGWAFRRLETEAELRRRATERTQRVLDQLEASSLEQHRLRRQMVEREREAAVTAERARMAGELHDTLAQGLAGVSTQLEIAEELLEEGHPARRRIGLALSLARSSLIEARRSVNELRPGPLEQHSFVGAIRTVLDQWRSRTQCSARLEITGDQTSAAPATEQALLRTAQEALTNIERHAKATEVTVTVSYLGDLIAVDIVDNGVGFVFDELAEPSASGGYGLHAMRDRVEAAGGTLAIESATGEGTMINAMIPLRPGVAGNSRNGAKDDRADHQGAARR
ncbi:sensor histidine kinase [Actinoalloteichus hymeniacidonis]|uniref:Oxygen sensor histidine kinase NreB n=1 Tax=Actinoalloteichus hymeniacidonis TaxID=340345 RepID=A0AAC9MWU7_9PSEU|nr:sensor histidine kinase [Actinoalloteichus hymeniacidonis]AOS61529.1 signal transduction histidine kinase [Actinoalloteichus hymeniacidonis]MBB5910463.1 signal transduction histidine kinase [Actinoalloteichus hymeniacidonis]